MSEIEINYQINNENKETLIIKVDEDYISQDYIKKNLSQYLISNKENYEDEFNLDKSDINFESIRYFDDNLKGWILLKENDILGLHQKEKIKILVMIRIMTKNELKIIKEFNEITNKFNEIANMHKNNNSKPTKTKNNDIKITSNESEIDIAVLTANPLFDKKRGKELKTMNDFNNIINNIKNVIMNSTKLINAEFYPLTEINLKLVLTHKPKIIHLIFKSTYIIPEKEEKIKDSINYINLLFEENNYCDVKEVSKENLDHIFNIPSQTEKTVLVISTQFTQDVYNIFKDYKFKNILVQHTTLADSSFIEEFNEHFYKNIIEQIDDCTINSYFEDAKYINNKSHQFCCCCHEHKGNCEFMKNLNNELYISDEIKDAKKEEELESKFIPHFAHLRYECKCNAQKDFCEHKKICEDNNKKRKDTICCCIKSTKNNKNKKNKDKHNINNVFFLDFSKKENNNEIKLGDGTNGFSVIRDIEYLSNYDKMKLIVGRSKIIYEVYNLLDSKYNIINIFKERQEFIDIADAIIEYLNERINLLYYEEIDNKNNRYSFEKIFVKKNDVFQPKNRGDKGKIIYFIINLDDELSKNVFEDIDLYKYQIVLFTKDEFTEKYLKNYNELKIKTLKLKQLKKEDYKILYQNEKIKKTKKDFEDYIEEKIKENKNLEIIDVKVSENNNNNEYLNIKEILFLFYCLKSGIYEMELNVLYPNKKIECNQIIIKDKKNLYKRVNINDNFDRYYNMMKNNISDEIKQSILIKLFHFYSKAFHKIIKIYKARCNTDNYLTFTKKYKPFDSLTSFSAMQNMGIWIQRETNDEIDIDKIKIEEKVKAEYKYFSDLSYNFINVLTDENIYLCKKSNDVWNKVKKDIEDISMTYYTCLLMFNITHSDLRNIITIFMDLFNNNKDFVFASSRLKLMKCMYSESIEHNLNYLNDLDKILYKFKEFKCIEGDLETMFAKFIINLKENKIDMYRKIIDKLNELENDNECQIENKNKFIKIFQSKVKYVYIKYKIKKEICEDTDLDELKDNKNHESLIMAFKEENIKLYEIKVYLLISEYFLLQYKSKNEVYYKINFYDYINFALYISNLCGNSKYINYYVKAKKAMKVTRIRIEKNEENYKRYSDKLKEMCDKYEYKYIKEKFEYYVDEEDNKI